MRLLFRLTLFAGLGSLAWAGGPTPIARPAVGAQPSGALIDINTATAAELRSLPGMGNAYVRRVIAGRPYTAKNQLVTRGVLPQEAYEKIQARIVARRTTK
jgi:competence protein ComEA